MAKIDDLAELIVEELNGFKGQLEKMEVLTKRIEQIPLIPDTSEMKSVLQAATAAQDQLVKEQNSKIAILTKQLSTSYRYPRWLIALLSALFFMCFSVALVSIYQLKEVAKTKEASFKNGQQEAIQHFDSFLKDNPKVMENYTEWIKSTK